MKLSRAKNHPGRHNRRRDYGHYVECLSTKERALLQNGQLRPIWQRRPNTEAQSFQVPTPWQSRKFFTSRDNFGVSTENEAPYLLISLEART